MKDLLTKLSELDDQTQERCMHSIELFGDEGWKLKATPLTSDTRHIRKSVMGQGIQAARELMQEWKEKYRGDATLKAKVEKV